MKKFGVIITVCLLSSLIYAQEVDLGVGYLQLLPGFKEKKIGTKDSRRGVITSQKGNMVINYDIGEMAGLHMSPKDKTKCRWYKEQVIGKQRINIGLI